MDNDVMIISLWYVTCSISFAVAGLLTRYSHCTTVDNIAEVFNENNFKVSVRISDSTEFDFVNESETIKCQNLALVCKLVNPRII